MADELEEEHSLPSLLYAPPEPFAVSGSVDADQFKFEGIGTGSPVGNLRQMGNPNFGMVLTASTMHQIWNNIDNTELRRREIEKLGEEEFLAKYGAEKRHEDAWGELWLVRFSHPKQDDMPVHEEEIAFIRVKNASPEPDNTYKFYYLRVPPTVRTAREGVAWTFNKEPDEYKPIKET